MVVLASRCVAARTQPVPPLDPSAPHRDAAAAGGARQRSTNASAALCSFDRRSVLQAYFGVLRKSYPRLAGKCSMNSRNPIIVGTRAPRGTGAWRVRWGGAGGAAVDRRPGRTEREPLSRLHASHVLTRPILLPGSAGPSLPCKLQALRAQLALPAVQRWLPQEAQWPVGGCWQHAVGLLPCAVPCCGRLPACLAAASQPIA